MYPPILRQFGSILLVALVSITAPAAAEPETWILAGRSTTIYFNQHVLADLGIEIAGPLEHRAGHFDYHEFAVSPDSPELRVAIPRGSFERLVSGSLRHGGGFDVRWDGGYIPLAEFELHPSTELYTFELRSTDGSVAFVLDYPHTRYIPESRRLVFINMDLRIAGELALRLGRPDLEGMTVGEGHVITEVVAGGTQPGGVSCVPDFTGEVDVELTGLDKLSEVFHTTERVAMAPSAELGNVGTDCQEGFVEGVDLRLAATPNTGSQLTTWQQGGLTLTESSLLAFEVVGERALTAVFESCPAERLLSPADVEGEALFETCQVLATGAGFQVSGPGGDVTFRAGERIALGDGFMIGNGARFRAVIDSKLIASRNQ